MNIFDTARNAWRAFTTDDLAAMGGGGGGGGSSVDREIVSTTYRVKTGFAGASVGDIVTSVRVLDVSTGTATQVGSTLWYNETAGAVLGSAPAAANLESTSSPGLTDAQLRASAVPVSASALPLPAGASTSALQTTANASLSNIDSKLPAQVNSRVPVSDDLGRAYQPIAGSTVSLAVTPVSTAAQAVTAGEVLRFSNAGTSPISVVFGASNVVAVAATAMDIMPGTAEAFTVPVGSTHFAAIMASGTGTLKITRGAGA